MLHLSLNNNCSAKRARLISVLIFFRCLYRYRNIACNDIFRIWHNFYRMMPLPFIDEHNVVSRPCYLINQTTYISKWSFYDLLTGLCCFISDAYYNYNCTYFISYLLYIYLIAIAHKCKNIVCEIHKCHNSIAMKLFFN
jgi:hypothetical protein